MKAGHCCYFGLILVAIFVLGLFPVFGQDVLFDDVNNCHEREIWSYLLDTLAAHGAVLHFVSEEGWANLDSMDMVWIECPTAPYSPGIKAALQNFARNGGKIVMGDVWQTMDALNDLLSDPGWNTTLRILTSHTSSNVNWFYPFHPFTDGVSSLELNNPRVISCGENAYPFAFGDPYYTQPVAAISYPFKDEDNCSTFVVLVTGTHAWETYFSIVANNYRFASNILLCAAGVSGFEIEGCATPEGIIEVDSITVCADPGETVTVWGTNLYPPIDVVVGSDTVTPTGYASDSAYLTFIAPDLPEGNYTVKVVRDGTEFYNGVLQIYCDWIDIDVSGGGCFMPGDTVYFSGENFESGTVIEFVEASGTTTSCTYGVLPPDSGWAIVPESLDTAGHHFYYLVAINPAGNYDRTYVQIPCPCPGTEDQFRTVQDFHPADTRNPTVDIIPPDSCIIVGNTWNLSWTTSADSFMSTYLWASRDPTMPITIYYAGGDTIVASWVNDANPTSYPFSSPDSGHWTIVVQATDWFGNRGDDTVGICFREDTICMDGFAWADTCDPDSVFFRIRHQNPIDNSTIAIMFAGVIYTIDSSEVFWMDDSTLMFLPPPAAIDTLHGLYAVGLADIISDISGHGLCHDSTEGIATSFRIPCCYGLKTQLWCSFPFMSFVSCEPFPVSFIVVDTTHTDPPDPSQLFFTVSVNGEDTVVTSPPILDISGTTDSLYISINPIWNDGDSVVITLDSVFTIRGCKTIPR